MRQTRSTWATAGVSLVAISVFPIYTIFVLAPRFEELLIGNTKDDAIQLARSLSAFVVEDERELSRGGLPTHLPDRLGSLEDGGHLVKMR
ncbi:MAG TPA: hypothetical protein VGB87_02795, partial [Vicinamibacteria bacterium]